MKATIKRTLCRILVLCIVINMLPLAVTASTGGKTSADAVAWAQNHANNASVLDYDGAYGAQCVDLIKYYYVYLGNSAVLGNGKDYATNSVPGGWSRIQYYSGFVPQPGDVAVWTTGGGGYGHVAIVISANASTMTVVEQNYAGKYCSKRTNASTSGIWGVIRPDFSGGGGGSSGDSCSCSASYAGNYTCTTSSLNLTIRNGHGSSYTKVGAIPSGATVYVSKASGYGAGNWAHVEYNGVSGYASMEYLQPVSTNHTPVGVLDEVTAGTQTVTVRGWAYDRNDLNRSVEIHVYVGGRHVGTGYANTHRPDVNADANHAGVGENHGFEFTCSVPADLTGSQTVTAYAIDSEGGGNPNLGSKSVNIPAAPTHADSPNIHWWISDSEYGDVPSEYKVGNRYYLCYELYDSVTGKSWDEVSSNSYTVTISFYNPDGSLKYETTDDDDACWISSVFTTPGTYTAKVVLAGDFGYTGETTLTVQDDPPTISSSVSTITLTLGQTESQTIQITKGGYYDGNYTFSISRSNTNVSWDWGTLSNGTAPITITANNAGSTVLTFKLIDKDTEAVLDSCTVTVNVISDECTVSYNANGGSGAPGSQTVDHNTSVTLPDTIPTRFGYNFVGWSTDKAATVAEYQPGGSYTITADTALYAVWHAAKSVNWDWLITANQNYPDTGIYFKVVPERTTSCWLAGLGYAGSATADCMIALYKSDGTLITFNKGNGTDGECELYYDLTAGTTYYISVKLLDADATGTIDVIAFHGSKITFDANGGLGAPGAKYCYDSAIDLPNTTPIRKGYTFAGWAKSATATAADYQPGGRIMTDSDVTLYAFWEKGCTGDHSYAASMNKKPTESAEGSLLLTCANCGSESTVTMPKLNKTDYTYTETKAATCTAEGSASYVWKDTSHGKYTITVTLPQTGHDYKSVVTAPTCVDDGYTTHTCANCGDTYKDSYTDSTGHSFGAWVTVTAPTCEENGEREKTCRYCAVAIAEAVPSTGHDYDSKVVPPTCTTDGYTFHTCTNCGHQYADTPVAALLHDFSNWTTVAEATCEQSGTRQRKCYYCLETEALEIPALGHDYESVVTAPTCEEDGCTTHTCTNCGDTYQDRIITAPGHDFTEWLVVNGASCTQPGKEQRRCYYCQKSEVREIAAAGHDYVSAVTAPTCEEDGCTAHTCSVCGDSFTDTYVDATGHSFSSGVCTGCGMSQFLWGDANSDGTVDNIDAMMILQYTVGLETATALNFAACDVSADGIIDNVDAMQILQYAVGLISEFRAER